MPNAVAKLIFTIFIFSVCALTVSAQTDCDLSAKNVALFLNLQIGMSPAQAQSVVGKSVKIKIKKRGFHTVFKNFIKKPAPESLRGVRALYLRFFDLKLYQIEIFYEPRPDLKTLGEVENALAAQLDFPVADWQMTNNFAEIKCGAISLAADNILNPRIELTDETVQAQIENSREKDKK